jgi:hypothetical protein
VNTIHLVDPAVRNFVSSAGLFDPERDPLDVFGKAVWHAANHSTAEMRFPAGADAVELLRST